MPRKTTVTFALLLVGFALTAEQPAQAQIAAEPSAISDPPVGAAPMGVAPVGAAPVGAAPLSANAQRQLPIRLVRRGDEGVPQPTQEQASRTAAKADRYGGPIPLPAAKNLQPGDKRQPLAERSSTTGNVTSVVLSSLAIVLGLFFLVVWLSRRALPKSNASLPTDVLELLGRSPLASRHHLQLIRLGRRLLLVSVTPESAETLAEITDPDEVNDLASLCRQNQAGSVTASFRQALDQLSQTPLTGKQRGSRATTPHDVDLGVSSAQRTSLSSMRESL